MIKRDNIIVYVPEGKALNEMIDILRKSPWDDVFRKGCAFRPLMDQFFFFQPYDDPDGGQWLKYNKDLLAEGEWVFNHRDFSRCAPFVDHMMKHFTIEEFMTKDFYIHMDW